MPHFFQQRDIAVENCRGIGKCFSRFGNTVFTNQMQGRIGRAVGVVADVVGFCAFKLKIRMERRNLDNPFQFVFYNGIIRNFQHLVEGFKIREQRWMNQ